MFLISPGANTDRYSKVGQRDTALLTAAMVSECTECGEFTSGARTTFEFTSAASGDTYLTVVCIYCTPVVANRLIAAEQEGNLA